MESSNAFQNALLDSIHMCVNACMIIHLYIIALGMAKPRLRSILQLGKIKQCTVHYSPCSNSAEYTVAMAQIVTASLKYEKCVLKYS